MQVVKKMRQELAFTVNSDPRYAGVHTLVTFPVAYRCSATIQMFNALLTAVADPNDKRKGVQGTESPFLQALRAMKRGLQMSTAMCEAFIKEIQGLDGVNLCVFRACLAGEWLKVTSVMSGCMHRSSTAQECGPVGAGAAALTGRAVAQVVTKHPEEEVCPRTDG